MLLWGVYASAWGAPVGLVDDAEVQAMVDALAPKVAAYVGRPLGLAPLQARIRGRRELLAGPSGPHRVEGALVVHTPVEGMSVVRERLGPLFDVYALPTDRIRPMLRCALIHEIVHVLQEVHAPIPTDADPDQRAGALALREGHATLLAREMCGQWEEPPIASLAEVAQAPVQDGSAGALRARDEFEYGLALATAVGGADAGWTALTAPPPRWADLAADAERTVLDLRPIHDALGALGQGDIPIERISPRALAGLGVPHPALSDGWRGGSGLVALFVLPSVEVGGATAFVEQRRQVVLDSANLEHVGSVYWGQGLGLLVPVRGAIASRLTKPLRTLDQTAGIARTLQVHVLSRSQDEYKEYWLATDRWLIGAATVRRVGGTPPPSAKEVTAALAALAAHLPTTLAASPTWTRLGPWLEDAPHP